MPRDTYDDDEEADRARRRRERRESRGAAHDDTYERERRRRKGHRATDSQGALLSHAAPPPQRHSRQQSDSEWDSPHPSSARRKNRDSQQGTPSSGRSRGSAPLSLDAIAKLDKANAKKAGWGGYDYDEDYLKEVRRKEKAMEKDRIKAEHKERRREKAAMTATATAAAAATARAVESDAAEEDEVRRKREEKRGSRRRESRGVTDDEGQRRRRESRGVTDDEGHRRRRESRGVTDDEGYRRRRESRGVTDDEGYRRRSAVRGEDKRRSMADAEKEEKRRRHEYTQSEIAEKKERKRQEREARKRRVVSGPLAEEGGIDDDEYQYMMEKRGGGGPSEPETEEEAARRKKKKRILIGIVIVLAILAIIIPVAVVLSNKKGGDPESVAAASADTPANSNLDDKDRNSVPEADRGGILDPWSWYDTKDFNVTYTKETVGGLPIIGLNSTWDDDVQANEKVPNLQDTFEYGKMPIRGVNVGGWLNIEPFITPSFFEKWGARDGVVDEWTLTTKLGAAKSAEQLEKHYSAFVTRQTFSDIRDAGFDHVRIPFGYWMVETYDGDPYVPKISWRYLLRGIEYARQNGLRINLDLHGAPGSQNGWNHSGRQGTIGWLNGTDGDLNAQRTLDIHHKLSVFFAQPRYKNIVTMYGIVNEPRMVDINTQSVVSWTQKAISQIRKDNITAVLVFGDGFLGLDNWQGQLQNNDNILLDVHQYVIFNKDQLILDHRDKLNFACEAWTKQSERSMDRTTGFGPTMCGEWSQADTDCTKYINNVGIGTRWEGTFDTGNSSTSILEPQCPTAKQNTCSCSGANADAASYSDAYKKWLYQFAVAQMESFEAGWGWFYWTWETEKAPQWSWKLGMKAGILPQKVYERGWTCPSDSSGLEDFEGLGLPEFY